MVPSKFESFPPCCQKILVELEREQRHGAQNCENGHLVSVEYAELMKQQPKKKPAPAPAH